MTEGAVQPWLAAPGAEGTAPLTGPQDRHRAGVLVAASGLLAAAALVLAEMLGAESSRARLGVGEPFALLRLCWPLLGAALGARIGAMTAAGNRRPLRLPVLLLVTVGVACFLAPWLLGALEHWQLQSAPPTGAGPSAPLALLLLAPLLLPPAFALGLLIPHLQALRRQGIFTVLVVPVGVGGAAGVAALLFVHALGAESLTALRLCGMPVLASALLLLLLDRPASAPRPDSGPRRGAVGRRRAVTLGAIFLAGSGLGAAVVLQGAFLGPLLGEHALLVPLLFATHLVGQAVGAGLCRLLLRRVPAGMLVVLGLTAEAVFIVGILPASSVAAGVFLGTDPSAWLPASAIALALVVAPPSIAAGIAVAAAMEQGGMGARPSPFALGQGLSTGLTGAVLGLVAAQAAGVPILGTPQTSLLAAGVLLAAAAGCCLVLGSPRARILVALPAVLLAGCVLPAVSRRVTSWGASPAAALAAAAPRPRGLNPSILGWGSALYARMRGGTPIDTPAGGGSFGDPASPLEVIEPPGGGRVLVSAGVARGRVAPSVLAPADPTEVLQGLAPTLLHPKPSRALVLDLGAGWATDVLTAANVPHVVALVPSARSLDIAARARSLSHLPARDDPRVHFRIRAERHVLEAAARGSEEQRFDLVLLRLGPPWEERERLRMSGKGLDRLLGALAPGGVGAAIVTPAHHSEGGIRSLLEGLAERTAGTWILRVGSDLVVVFRQKSPDGQGLLIRPDRWERLLAPASELGLLVSQVSMQSPAAILRFFAADQVSLGRVLKPDASERKSTPSPAWQRLRRDHPRESDRFLNDAFPPQWAEALPDPDLRHRWLRGALGLWMDEGNLAIARRFDAALPWAQDPDLTLLRLRLKLETAGLRADPKDGTAREVLKSLVPLRRQSPRDPELAVLHVRALGRNTHGELKRVQAARETIASIARSFPEDGVVLAAAGKALYTLGDREGAIATLKAALDIGPPRAAPPGTGVFLARLLFNAGSPSVQEDDRVRALLRQDPHTFEDPQALDLLLRLELLARHEASLEPVSDLVRSLREAQTTQGGKHRAAARRLLAEGDFPAAVREADAATLLWPESHQAWFVCGVAHLLREVPPPGSAGRSAAARNGIAALSESILRAQDAAEQSRRVEEVLGWFGLETSDH